jgi:hypothetical protein
MLAKVTFSPTHAMNPPSGPEPQVQLTAPASRPTLSRSDAVCRLTTMFMNWGICPSGEPLSEHRARAAAYALVSCLIKSELNDTSIGTTATKLLAPGSLHILPVLDDLCATETDAGIKKICLGKELTKELQNPKPSYLRTAIMGLTNLNAMNLTPVDGEFELRHFPWVKTFEFNMCEREAELSVNALEGTVVEGFWSNDPTRPSRVDYFHVNGTYARSRPLEGYVDETWLNLQAEDNTDSQTPLEPRLKMSSPGAASESILSFVQNLNGAAALPPRIQEPAVEAVVLASDKPHQLLAEILPLQ